MTAAGNTDDDDVMMTSPMANPSLARNAKQRGWIPLHVTNTQQPPPPRGPTPRLHRYTPPSLEMQDGGVAHHQHSTTTTTLTTNTPPSLETRDRGVGIHYMLPTLNNHHHLDGQSLGNGTGLAAGLQGYGYGYEIPTRSQTCTPGDR